MKRMVLIPEEKLLQYEQQQKGDMLHDVPNKQYGLGEKRKKKKKKKKGSYQMILLFEESQRL